MNTNATAVTDHLEDEEVECPYRSDCDTSMEPVDFYRFGPWGPEVLVCHTHYDEVDYDEVETEPQAEAAPAECRTDLGPGELCSVCWTDHKDKEHNKND